VIINAAAVRRSLEAKYGKDMVTDELVAMVLADLVEGNGEER
jgi:hypothetical protein